MDATNNIATDLFYKIRSRFSGLKLGKYDGTITINPEEARFFDFDYMDGGNAIGHISISLAEENSMKVYFSTGITESMSSSQRTGWYGFLRELRQFAKRRLMAFDTRDIAKDNLDKRDYAFLTQHNKPKLDNQQINPVGESIMSESAMYGTKTVSYQKLLDTRLIIKHSRALTDDQQPGARTRNISALFVENQDGERFKYPFVHLAGARAMQRHVANGGLPYDEIGKSIVGMSEEIAQLKSFSNYVVRNDLMNSETNDLVSRSTDQLNHLRETLHRISKQKHYEAYKANFQAPNQVELPEEVIEDFVNKFTVKNFKEDIKSVFPILYRLTQEGKKNLGYNDIVEMTKTEEQEEEVKEQATEIDQFEAWVRRLGEESAITSDDQEEKLEATKELQELVKEHFAAGVDGTNAIESLKGIIEDAQLFQQIKAESKEDPNADVRGLVKEWLSNNAPDVISELDFGDFEEQDAPAEPEAMQDEEEPQESQESDKLGSVEELAEFIHSFYDRETNSFPKGPEGVCTMVGKKFGERAEMVARKMVERMAPHQSTEQNPELAELARLKELSGLEEGPFTGVGKIMMKHKLKKSIKQDQDAEDDAFDKMHDYDFDDKRRFRHEDDFVKANDSKRRKEKALKRLSREDIELESIKQLSGISKGIFN